QVWRAGLGLVRHRVAVHRRPALLHIGDVKVRRTKPDAGKQRVEKLAGRAHERLTLPVLVEAWSLSHDHDVGRARPNSGDGLGACRVEAAFGARADFGVELTQLRSEIKRL